MTSKIIKERRMSEVRFDSEDINSYLGSHCVALHCVPSPYERQNGKGESVCRNLNVDLLKILLRRKEFSLNVF